MYLLQPVQQWSAVEQQQQPGLQRLEGFLDVCTTNQYLKRTNTNEKGKYKDQGASLSSRNNTVMRAKIQQEVKNKFPTIPCSQCLNIDRISKDLLVMCINIKPL